MKTFVQFVRSVSMFCGIFAAGLIALAVLVVCQMVFVRYVLNSTTIWQTDFVTYSLIGATFIGSSYVLMTHGHVNVDILPHYLGPKGKRVLGIFGLLVVLLFAVVATVLTAQFWHEAFEQRWVSDTMWRARLWIPYASMPIGLALLSLQCAADLYTLATSPAAAASPAYEVEARP
jgi:TRAP-type C4-dicarboxylate transport system permease small subunit